MTLPTEAKCGVAHVGVLVSVRAAGDSSAARGTPPSRLALLREGVSPSAGLPCPRPPHPRARRPAAASPLAQNQSDPHVQGVNIINTARLGVTLWGLRPTSVRHAVPATRPRPHHDHTPSFRWSSGFLVSSLPQTRDAGRTAGCWATARPVSRRSPSLGRGPHSEERQRGVTWEGVRPRP